MRTVRIGLFHQPKACMGELVGVAMRRLGFAFVPLTREGLAMPGPLPFDVLVFPGGWYFFNNRERRKLRAFVRAGGGYVGICCGAINAVQLGLLPATLIEMCGIGPHPIEPVDGAHPILRGVAKRSKKPWRRYESFQMVRYNGWPMKLRRGAKLIAAYDLKQQWAAIASAQFGKGRVVASSPHPEGARFKRGDFHDRQRHRLTYDGFAMGTTAILGNAIGYVSAPKR